MKKDFNNQPVFFSTSSSSAISSDIKINCFIIRDENDEPSSPYLHRITDKNNSCLDLRKEANYEIISLTLLLDWGWEPTREIATQSKSNLALLQTWKPISLDLYARARERDVEREVRPGSGYGEEGGRSDVAKSRPTTKVRTVERDEERVRWRRRRRRRTERSRASVEESGESRTEVLPWRVRLSSCATQTQRESTSHLGPFFWADLFWAHLVKNYIQPD